MLSTSCRPPSELSVGGRGRQIFSRDAIAREIPYRQVAENVAYNSDYVDPAKQAVEGWIESSGHEEKMTGDYDLTGIGIARNGKGEYDFTQIFVRPR